jgi:hypothetical protein
MLLALCLIGNAVGAVVINYDESVMGDLTNPSCPPDCSTKPTTIGTLGIGTNTVKGSMFYTVAGPDPMIRSDADGFSFSMPAGTILDSIAVHFYIVANGRTSSTRFKFHENLTTPLVMQEVDFPDPWDGPLLVDMFSSALPRTANGYLVRQDRWNCVPNPMSWVCAVVVDYTWSLVVRQSVPEPPGIALLVLALFANLYVVSTRRRLAGHLLVKIAVP